jgi:hypothetical protein
MGWVSIVRQVTRDQQRQQHKGWVAIRKSWVLVIWLNNPIFVVAKVK